MVHLNKVKRDNINYGAVKVYETFLTVTQDEIDPELFTEKQLKDIFKQKYDIIKINIDFVVDEENEIIESEKLVFRLTSVSKTEIAYMSNAADNGSTSLLVLSKDGEGVSEEVTEYAGSIPITWSKLKALRDGGKLVPGTFYRITDYMTTTSTPNTSSAGHQFDIIVRADSANKLNEEASAIQHEGDEYFKHNNLSAWKLKYCLDNDQERFDWANITGKGVIYRMIDEFGNDCPYDFKNILFNGKYTFNLGGGDYEGAWDEDTSINKNFFVHHNVMGVLTQGAKQVLNNNIFEGENIHDNKLGNDCSKNRFSMSFYNNTFGNGCSSNTFKDHCYSNKFGNTCNRNTFGYNCHFNKFGTNCYRNTFKNHCYSNIFESGCYENTFGDSCHKNTFEKDCYENTFGMMCGYNIFGIGCYTNTFGNDCSFNKFGTYCYANTLGPICRDNIFGNGCNDIRLENNCNYNIFGDGCRYIGLGTSVYSQREYYQYNIIDSGCRYLHITGNGDVLYSNQVQNIHVHSGVSGTGINYKTITVDRGLQYSTDIYAAGSKEIILD